MEFTLRDYFFTFSLLIDALLLHCRETDIKMAKRMPTAILVSSEGF